MSLAASTAPTPRSRPTSAGQLLSIGQVLARLSPEFPDLSPSKLRFLEEQRLISPARTESGYRKFSGPDLERLKLILVMQRDHYLPLKVIRSYLTDLDAGKQPAWPGVSPTAPSMLTTERRYTRDELVREAQASPALLAEAISASILSAADTFAEDALGVLKALVELQRSGIEPRHLRSVRAAAERESDLIESAVLPLSKRRDGAGRARELALDMARQLEVVRGSLVRQALSRRTS